MREIRTATAPEGTVSDPDDDVIGWLVATTTAACGVPDQLEDPAIARTVAALVVATFDQRLQRDNAGPSSPAPSSSMTAAAATAARVDVQG